MDATFWAFVGLILFLALVVYFGAPAAMGKSLDARAERIRHDLDEARRLRDEAQQLLAEYQRKRKEAEQEAGDIVAAAEREADAKARYKRDARRAASGLEPTLTPSASTVKQAASGCLGPRCRARPRRRIEARPARA